MTTEWVYVPKEPTPGMCEAARGVPEPVRPYPPHFHLIWDAMLAAAPSAPLPLTDEQLQAEFERRVLDNQADPPGCLAKDEHGDYAGMFIHVRWSEFRAGAGFAAALAAPSAPPAEPITDEQIYTLAQQHLGGGRGHALIWEDDPDYAVACGVDRDARWSIASVGAEQTLALVRAALAAVAPAEPISDNWKPNAAAWLRAKADAQEKTNLECPEHVKCYPSWEKRVRDLRWDAEELEGAFGSYGPPASDANDPHQATPVAYRWYEEKFGEYRYDEVRNPYRTCEPLFSPGTIPRAVWERVKDGVPADYTEEEFRAYSAIQLAREQAHKADQIDANRYQWLRRDDRPCDKVEFVEINNGCGGLGAATETELDAAIDAAMLAAAAPSVQPQEPVAWFKHGPYDDGEPLTCVFEDPHDDVCYSPLVYAAPVAADQSQKSDISHLASADAGRTAGIERAADWGRLYDVASRLAAYLGAHGTVEAKSDLGSLLLDALRRIDGDNYCPGLMPAHPAAITKLREHLGDTK